MAESKTIWVLKSLGIVIVAAVLTSLLTTWLQHLIWGQANVAISGGASAGVAVAVLMSRRHRLPADEPKG
ncbi:MAG: hypothetical protein WD801_14630 [Gemmatimonadaceae bacterium]